jgi:hypothetical protein
MEASTSTTDADLAAQALQLRKNNAARRLSARSYRLHTTSRRRKKQEETRRRAGSKNVNNNWSSNHNNANKTTTTTRNQKTNLHANKHKTFVHVQQSDNYERNDTEWRVTARACRAT